MPIHIPPEALKILRQIRDGIEHDGELRAIVRARDEVHARYQPMFRIENIDALQADEFRKFLSFKNNRHWLGLSRLGGMVNDLPRLKSALRILLDESSPIEVRLNELLPKKPHAYLPKFGKAVITPILMIAYPDKYAVWNTVSGKAMDSLGLKPKFDGPTKFGQKYVAINEVAHAVAKELELDLWTLDALWWRVVPKSLQPDPAAELEEVDVEAEIEERQNEDQRFGMERHLHNFLLDNWEHTDLGREWELLEEDGDIEGVGYERSTEIGKIDLLAKHKNGGRWLVIELKRGQTSDDTMGQVQRYMGWVKKNLAGQGDSVEGLIVALDHDAKLKYALSVTDKIKFMRYSVSFALTTE